MTVEKAHTTRRNPQVSSRGTLSVRHGAAPVPGGAPERDAGAHEAVEEGAGEDGRVRRADLAVPDHRNAGHDVAQGVAPGHEREGEPQARQAVHHAERLDKSREFACNDGEHHNRRGLGDKRDRGIEPRHVRPVVAPEIDCKACNSGPDERCNPPSRQGPGLGAREHPEQGQASGGHGSDHASTPIPLKVSWWDE
eukprot:CAMPEP_0168454184 /NCGR_PEP_ID=MMETSP0228-20121227/50086_1 /TAXON_ID=133427 /ORGANISM="Protoceratium reticulatum, Strain CCCM 535 (=CCMP 1889)" /LENGTH=194 /DNA_ID=CAMNT_0008468955 /DNA_START=94 /DNA_END=675 /DNA_ORIENTATION=-